MLHRSNVGVVNPVSSRPVWALLYHGSIRSNDLRELLLNVAQKVHEIVHPGLLGTRFRNNVIQDVRRRLVSSKSEFVL